MPHVLHCADSALLVSFGDERRPWARVLALDAALAGAPGISEAVPGLESLLLLLDGTLPAGEVRVAVEGTLAGLDRAAPAVTGREHQLTVHFGGEDGPDLAAVATHAGLDAVSLVALLTATPLTVALIGHLPGLPYLRGLPASLDLPRRTTPRAAVAAGSLGVVGGMACIYPARAPGGWHIVGRTDAALFNPQRRPPALLAAGDRVRLVAG